MKIRGRVYTQISHRIHVACRRLESRNDPLKDTDTQLTFVFIQKYETGGTIGASVNIARTRAYWYLATHAAICYTNAMCTSSLKSEYSIISRILG